MPCGLLCGRHGQSGDRECPCRCRKREDIYFLRVVFLMATRPLLTNHWHRFDLLHCSRSRFGRSCRRQIFWQLLICWLLRQSSHCQFLWLVLDLSGAPGLDLQRESNGNTKPISAAGKVLVDDLNVCVVLMTETMLLPKQKISAAKSKGWRQFALGK